MNKLRDAAQQALEFCEFCWRDVALNDYAEEKREAAEAALRAALAEPQPQSEPVAFTFAGLTVREIQIPAGMTVRIDRDAIIVARQRDQNDPLIVEPQHDPSHLPYAALAEPQPQPEPVGWYDSKSGWADFHSTKPVRKPSSPDAEWIPFYTHPPQRQPLSDEQINALELPESGKGTVRDLVRIVERAHGIGGAT